MLIFIVDGGWKENMMYVANRLLQILRRKMILWFVVFFLLSATISVEAATITYDLDCVVENFTNLKNYCVFL